MGQFPSNVQHLMSFLFNLPKDNKENDILLMSYLGFVAVYFCWWNNGTFYVVDKSPRPLLREGGGGGGASDLKYSLTRRNSNMNR